MQSEVEKFPAAKREILEKFLFAQLPPAPDNLIRRFTPRLPTDKRRGVNPWLPIPELGRSGRPEDRELYYRVRLADLYRTSIDVQEEYEFAGGSTLTPEKVLSICHKPPWKPWELPPSLRQHPDVVCDLDDIYVCEEATLLPLYLARLGLTDYSLPARKMTIEYLIAKHEHTLKMIGDALVMEEKAKQKFLKEVP